jgi:hypothetical protein
MNDPLDQLYAHYLGFTSTMIEEYGGLEVAAIMMTQALSIYRTVLDEMDYNKMVDSMSENRSKIQKFTPTILQ